MMKKKNITTVRRQADGSVVKVIAKGESRIIKDKTDWKKLSAMTEKEVNSAALQDEDNLPLTYKELKQFKSVPNPKEIRLRLHMTQEQFAVKFHVPLGTLRDWEQGAKYPDSAARSYLRVIDKVPQIVIQALGR